jgi:hypothetical protein
MGWISVCHQLNDPRTGVRCSVKTEHQTPCGRHAGDSLKRCSVFGIDRTPNGRQAGAMIQNGMEAEQALLEALTSIGLTADQPIHPDSGVDIWVDVPSGGRVPIEVKFTSLASVHGLQGQLDRWERRTPAAVDGLPLIKVLVANRITADARHYLRESEWGWLDLRGHIHVVAPGLFVDANVEIARALAHRFSDPFAGKSGLEVAADMLLNPHAPVGIRALAKRIHRSPSTVSEVVTRLREAGLIDDDNKPVVPDLFWSLAPAWRPMSADVTSLPDIDDRPLTTTLKVGRDDGSKSGWALTDSSAASIYGAPVALRQDYPPTLYVPDETILRRAVQVLGPTSLASSRSATLEVAPVSAVSEQRINDWPTSTWPLAHPLFVALDLAQDPGRGREILSDWTPPDRWIRVW